MLKENWNENEKISYSDFNLIIAEVKSLCSIYNISESLSSLSLGDFLFCEIVQKIENAIDTMCDLVELDYAKKNWYNMSVINYSDVNKWSIALNMLRTGQCYYR